MNKPKVYIDGKEGTTGLQIYQRLGGRDDIELLLIDEDKRKDTAEREKLLNAADLVFLCLPDDAARQAVSLIHNDRTRVIDASTAHRVAPGWDYGFAELSSQHRQAILTSARVANPGCHATGFISAVYPLVAMGLLPRESMLSCFSLTGYSGGGKKMIAQYEGEDKDQTLYSPSVYAMAQGHKHLPEMKKVCALEHPPVFSPIVDDYYKGMAATVPLHRAQLRGVDSLEQLWEKISTYYAGQKLVKVCPAPVNAAGGGEGLSAGGKIYANALAGRDDLYLVVAGNDEQFTVTALFDNLGKGASGAAVQNMNLMLGFDETTGLNLR